MSDHTVERKLTAILSADVVGYSRLMGEDDAATVDALIESRRLFAERIAEHRGRVVNAPGDAILAEFASVLDAVQCAVEIQRNLHDRGSGIEAERRMQFRIGVNLGDVIVKEGAIYGDGVNIAARLEALAEPGGICISRMVFDNVEGRLPLEFEYLGEQQVKNIDKPVRAYRVAMDGGRPTGAAKSRSASDVAHATEKPALSLPDRPSIAVLPFANLSADPEQEYFSDGITEDIITDLSKLRNLFVIARNSSFVYKGRAVDVRQVGRELGVRHILEGSVRKAGDRVRITTQLVDARTAEHVWAQRYDRELKDIFAVQDELTRDIVTELDVLLVEGEQARLWRKTTHNPEAYDYFLRGRDAHIRFTREDNEVARALIERAIELDPGFVRAIVLLGWHHFVLLVQGWSSAPEKTLNRAYELGMGALELDPSYGDAHTLVGELEIVRGNLDRGMLELREGVALSPNSSVSAICLGRALAANGKPEEALRMVDNAFRLSPYPSDWWFGVLGSAHLSAGQFEEAISALQKCLARIPDYILAHFLLTVAYMESGRVQAGQQQAKEVLRVNPDFSSETAKTFFHDSTTQYRVKSLLQKAGLP